MLVGEGPLGRVLAQDGKARWRQNLAPFRLGLFDLEGAGRIGPGRHRQQAQSDGKGAT